MLKYTPDVKITLAWYTDGCLWAGVDATHPDLPVHLDLKLGQTDSIPDALSETALLIEDWIYQSRMSVQELGHAWVVAFRKEQEEQGNI